MSTGNQRLAHLRDSLYVATKRAERDKLTAAMGEPNFWDNSKSQQVIQKIKPLNGLINPYDDLDTALQDLCALAELSEEEAA